MDRVPDFESVGCGFDPRRGHLMFMDEETLGPVRLLPTRLERISADSYWAHRVSGVRGSLLRITEYGKNL